MPRRLFAGFSQRQWGDLMKINSSTVQRNLDAKLKIGNIEALDLLIALICGAMMNLFFSGHGVRTTAGDWRACAYSRCLLLRQAGQA